MIVYEYINLNKGVLGFWGFGVYAARAVWFARPAQP